MAKYMDSSGLFYFMSIIKDYIDNATGASIDDIPIPIYQGGTGEVTAAAARVALGCASQDDLDTVIAAFTLYLPLTGGTLTNTLYLKDATIDRDAAANSTAQIGKAVVFNDKDGERIGTVRVDRNANGIMAMKLGVHTDDTNGDEFSEWLELRADRNGGGADRYIQATAYSYNLLAAGIDRDTNPSADVWSGGFAIHDKDGERIGVMQPVQRANGTMANYFQALNDKSDNTQANNYIYVGVQKNGTPIFGTADNAKFRSDLNIAALTGGNSFTGTQTVTSSSFVTKYLGTVNNVNEYNRDGALPTADRWSTGLYVHDANGETTLALRSVRRATSGRMDTFLYAYNEANGGNSGDPYQNFLALGVTRDGTKYFNTADNAKFRSDLGLMGAKSANNYMGLMLPDGTDTGYIRTTSNGLIPYQSGGASQVGTSTWPFNWGYFVRLAVTGTGDAAGASAGSPGLTVGNTSGDHLAIDTNEIMAKSSATATGVLNLNIDGGNVIIGKAGDSTVNLRGTVQENGTALSSKYAAASHGNHVPTLQTADNAKFLRNDNTWQTVTPANIGALALTGGTVSGNIIFKDGSFARNTTPGTSDHWAPGVVIYDKNGDNFGQVRVIRRTSGRNDLALGSYGADGTSNYLNIGVNSNGTKYYGVSDAAAFRSAISAASSTHTHSIGRTTASCAESYTINAGKTALINMATVYNNMNNTQANAGRVMTGAYGWTTGDAGVGLVSIDYDAVRLRSDKTASYTGTLTAKYVYCKSSLS